MALSIPAKEKNEGPKSEVRELREKSVGKKEEDEGTGHHCQH